MVKKAKEPETKKKRTGSKPAGKTLQKLLKAPEDQAFYCIDGRIFYDLQELANGIMEMSDETFYHHVHSNNNDFGNWVRDVIDDIVLADELYRSSGKDECASYIIARLDLYE